MEVNAVFEDVKIYRVQDRLDVVQGQAFSIEYTGDVPADLELFTSNDPALSVDGANITADNEGESKIRFMSGTAVVKDLLIVVVGATHPNATTLNGSLGSPISK